MSYKVTLNKWNVLGCTFLLEAFFLCVSVKLVVGVPCAHVGRRVHHINDIFPPLKWKEMQHKETNQEIHLWAIPWVVSPVSSMSLMMNWSAIPQDWENLSFFSTPNSYLSVMVSPKLGELLPMKIKHPSKNCSRGLPKQQIGINYHFIFSLFLRI